MRTSLKVIGVAAVGVYATSAYALKTCFCDENVYTCSKVILPPGMCLQWTKNDQIWVVKSEQEKGLKNVTPIALFGTCEYRLGTLKSNGDCDTTGSVLQTQRIQSSDANGDGCNEACEDIPNE